MPKLSSQKSRSNPPKKTEGKQPKKPRQKITKPFVRANGVKVKNPTARKTFKEFELTVARMFGAERNPLSGRMSGHTASDTRHPKLFIECKLKGKSAIHSLYKKTEGLADIEDKIPMLALKEKGGRGFLIVIRAVDLEAIATIYNESRNKD